MASENSPFFFSRRRVPTAAYQLVCFPYAGGAALAYRTWEAKLAPNIEVCAVELPGRGRRLREPAHRRLHTLVPALTEAVATVLDGRPFAFFGHSMGALLAFEVAHRLRRAGAELPRVLFLSARGMRGRDAPIHHLPQEQLIARLRHYGGTPTEVLESPELMELVLPTVRADFEIALGEGSDATEEPLPIPIEAMGGADDSHVPTSDLDAWAERTTSEFRSTVFPGGHFYQREQEDALLHLLTSRLTRHAPQTTGSPR